MVVECSEVFYVANEVVGDGEEYFDCVSEKLRLCCCLQSAFRISGADKTNPSADELKKTQSDRQHEPAESRT